MKENKIEIYQTIHGIILDVKFSGETVWLTQEQLSVLFERDQSVISRHLGKLFKEGELDKKSNMQKMHIANSDKPVVFYNLDVIISVGYRVKSIRGTQFRQWATQRLKAYLLEGIVINEKRLEQKNKEIRVLHDGIRIITRAIEETVSSDNGFEWLKKFSLGLKLLDDYDHESLDTGGRHFQQATYPTFEEYMELVTKMSIGFNSSIFGKQKDKGFLSAINQIRQGFGKEDAYPSIEEKAAMLLYLVVKNHAFVDGNKRIAAACFLLFLERNGMLYVANKQAVISSEALASLTLFVASSKSAEMDTVKNLLVSILNRNLIKD